MADLGVDSGLLAEHEAPSRERESKAYEPSPSEERAIKLAERLFAKAKRHRSQYDRNWPKYYRLFRGKQWDTPRPSYRHSEIVNHIFKSIQSTVPIQMDARPRFEFLPEEPSDLEFAEILNQAAESDWVRNNWSLEFLEVLYDANFYGAGLSTVLHDKDANYRTGKICYKSADPFYFYPDPDATDVNKNCGFAVTAEPIDVQKLKRRYPKYAQYLKPDLVDLQSSMRDLSAQRRQSPNDSFAVHTDGLSDPTEKDKALVVTVWITPDYLVDDYEETETETVGPDGQVSKLYEQKARWPRGRKIVVCNKVLLEDDHHPYDDAEIPYQRLLNYVLPREFWGISEIEQLEGPQKTFNKILNFALDVMTLMGNPIWVVDTSADVDTENLVNKPGMVVEKTPGSEVRREEGVQLQPYVMQLAQGMVQWFNDVSGNQEVSQGRNPTGITAMGAIQALQEAAYTRLRQKSRNSDYYLQDVGRQWLSRTMQFRSAPEMFRLTNKQGVEQYFRMHVEDYEKTTEEEVVDPVTGAVSTQQTPTGEMGKRAVVQPYGENGLMDPTAQRVYEIRGTFDVRVSTGSALPFAKAEKEQKLLGLFDRGIIDAEEVLKGTDFPNWQAVHQRVQQKALADAQAAAAAQAGGAPTPAAAPVA
jgi:hypothetical protein